MSFFLLYLKRSDLTLMRKSNMRSNTKVTVDAMVGYCLEPCSYVVTRILIPFLIRVTSPTENKEATSRQDNIYSTILMRSKAPKIAKREPREETLGLLNSIKDLKMLRDEITQKAATKTFLLLRT